MDETKRKTEVIGCPPVRWVQDGKAYNNAGELLGNWVDNRLVVDDVRDSLVRQAKELGIRFHPKVSTEKLRDRINDALGDTAKDNPPVGPDISDASIDGGPVGGLPESD